MFKNTRLSAFLAAVLLSVTAASALVSAPAFAQTPATDAAAPAATDAAAPAVDPAAAPARAAEPGHVAGSLGTADAQCVCAGIGLVGRGRAAAATVADPPWGADGTSSGAVRGARGH